ncbi:hypothetical protein ONZ45_g9467 [Pleurotus djamor]|nr:hypothetical protein ONZ45_g9467 [Pleurotus djamor]
MESSPKVSNASSTRVDEEKASMSDHTDTVLVNNVLSTSSTKYRVDGGFRAWSALAGGLLVTTVTFGYANAFGVYQDIYTRSHAASASNVSWVGSTQLFLLFTVGLPAGRLLDKGYFRHTILAGSIIYVFSLFMVSLTHPDKYYQIYLAQGLGLGIGSGLLYVPAVAVQGHHWQKHRSFAMSVVVTGSSIGGIAFPIMLNQLFKSSVGFASGVRASAYVCLGVLVIANMLLNDNPSEEEEERAEKPSLKEIFTDVPFMILILGVPFVTTGIFFPYFYLQLFSILHGVEPNIAFYTLAVMNAAGIIGRMVPGTLADYYGPFNVVLPGIFISVILIFSLLAVKTVAGSMIFAVLYGLSSGTFFTLCAPCAAALVRKKNELGIRFGICFFTTGFGALIGTPIDGALLGHTFPWLRPIVFSGISVTIGFVCVAVARQMLAKRHGTQFV